MMVALRSCKFGSKSESSVVVVVEEEEEEEEWTHCTATTRKAATTEEYEIFDLIFLFLVGLCFLF